MLYGIGCDLCEIAHLEKSLTGAHAAAFIRRVYGEAERAALSLDEPLPAGRSAAHRLASAAANFAAKEAFLKAAGTGLREPFSLCEIEAIRQAAAEGEAGETGAGNEESPGMVEAFGQRHSGLQAQVQRRRSPCQTAGVPGSAARKVAACEAGVGVSVQGS